MRYHSALALGSIGDKRATNHLTKGLDDPIGAVRLACVKAIEG